MDKNNKSVSSSNKRKSKSNKAGAKKTKITTLDNSTFSQTDEQNSLAGEVQVNSGEINVVVDNQHPIFKHFTATTTEDGSYSYEFIHQNLSQFFSVISFENKKFKIKCKIVDNSQKCCDGTVTVTDESMTNAYKHLRNIHQMNTKVLQGKLAPSQEKIEPYRSSDEKQQLFDENVLNLMAVDGLPFSFMEGHAFQSLIYDIDSRITVQRRPTYVSKLGAIVENEIKPSITDLIQTQGIDGGIHFSTDIWSTRRRSSILGIKYHLVDENFDLISHVLRLKPLDERHFAKYIQKQFNSVISEVKIADNKVGVVVTDGGSNMKAAFALKNILETSTTTSTESNDSQDDLSSSGEQTTDESDCDEAEDIESGGDEGSDVEDLCSDDGESILEPVPLLPIKRLPCLAHLLQTVINTAVKKDPKVLKFLNYVNNVMVFFKRSTKWSDELRKLTNLDVIIKSPTRWNGLLDMVQRLNNAEFLSSVKKVLAIATQEPGQKNLPKLPSDFSVEMSTEIYSLLSPFGIMTDILQSDKVPTSNSVFYESAVALNKIVKLIPKYFGNFKQLLLSTFVEKFDKEKVFFQEEYILASFLDPRQKLTTIKILNRLAEKINGLKVPSLEEAKDIIERQFAEASQTIPSQESNSSGLAQNSMFAAFDEILETASADKTDLEKYGETVEDPSTNVLEYWKKNRNEMKVLSLMARKYLGVPSSSGGIERTFSITGFFSRARRSRISRKSLENLVLFREEKREILQHKIERIGKHPKKQANPRDNSKGNNNK